MEKTRRKRKKGEDLRKGKIVGNTDGEEDGTEGPMFIEAEIRGHFVHRIGEKPDGSRNHPLVGFSGEIIWPLMQISLLAKIGDEEHSTSAWMNFMVVRSPSLYNRIIGRPGVRRIHVVPSIAHGMLKFSVTCRTVTLRSSRIIQLECTMVLGPEVPQPVINQVTKENIQKPADMTRVPHHIAEHSLNIRKGCPPVRQKKRGQAPERNKAIYEEMKKLVDAGIMKEDVKRLNGKLASLNRFLSKSAENSLPFFKNLKKCTKKGDFQWTAEAETTFNQMKTLITELPMLTAPKEKEELVIYLAAAKEAVSAVLMTERDEKQMLIYFVIRALQGPEINYTPKEKLILALILADFIVEHPEDDLPDTPMKDKEEFLDPWIQFTDGSSCIDGFEAVLIITNLKGTKFTYALRFMFHATNNEAEYEGFDRRALNNKTNRSEKSLSKCQKPRQHFQRILHPTSTQMREQKRRCAEQDGIHQLCPPKFGLPVEIISDNGKQFRDNPFKDWFEKLCIRQCFTSIKHTQAISLVERANRSLGEGIKAQLNERSKKWMEDISHVLWEHRTMIKYNNGETSFSLTYGTEAVISVEIGMPTLRTAKVDMIKMMKLWKLT
uniref:Reverse transcriptase domain-containing protein n=1 Tax=Tanacetum cinerariifolium TaxID=118510 RepID=A0A6L2JUZ2_TANCI|nr:reverse transcriptase domain-containing protein [Tanacetum cinerariifolium]